jgi:hypothetical protein
MKRLKNIREPGNQREEYQGSRISDYLSDSLISWSPLPGNLIF